MQLVSRTSRKKMPNIHARAFNYHDLRDRPPRPCADFFTAFFTAFFAAFLAAIARCRTKGTSRKAGASHIHTRLRVHASSWRPPYLSTRAMPETRHCIDTVMEVTHPCIRAHPRRNQQQKKKESGHACVCASEAPPPRGKPAFPRSSPAPLCSSDSVHRTVVPSSEACTNAVYPNRISTTYNDYISG